MRSTMSTLKRNQFVVRQASDADLVACSQLDHTYTTSHVWQVDLREEGDETSVRFRVAHLPREVRVSYPRDRQTLLQSWQTRDCFLVAATGDIILGYVNMRWDAPSRRGWIHDLVVDQRVRRRKIGSALLEQALRWARLHEVAYVTLDLQTKNYPALCFAQAHGFAFCGFNDHYYLNRDIALFFGRAV
jgi:ribosomal protein S18 acetylase RimI-like enzyme